MNPKQLRQKLAANCVEAELQGVPIRLRKIGTRGGMALMAIHKMLPKNELGQPVGDEAMWEFFGEALAYSIVAEDGSLPFDSDEGRAALMEVPLEELVPLAEKALQFSGMAVDPAALEAAKKNCPTKNDSPDCSPEPSGDSTTKTS